MLQALNALLRPYKALVPLSVQTWTHSKAAVLSSALVVALDPAEGPASAGADQSLEDHTTALRQSNIVLLVRSSAG